MGIVTRPATLPRTTRGEAARKACGTLLLLSRRVSPREDLLKEEFGKAWPAFETLLRACKETRSCPSEDKAACVREVGVTNGSKRALFCNDRALRLCLGSKMAFSEMCDSLSVRICNPGTSTLRTQFILFAAECACVDVIELLCPGWESHGLWRGALCAAGRVDILAQCKSLQLSQPRCMAAEFVTFHLMPAILGHRIDTVKYLLNRVAFEMPTRSLRRAFSKDGSGSVAQQVISRLLYKPSRGDAGYSCAIGVILALLEEFRNSIAFGDGERIAACFFAEVVVISPRSCQLLELVKIVGREEYGMPDFRELVVRLAELGVTQATCGRMVRELARPGGVHEYMWIDRSSKPQCPSRYGWLERVFNATSRGCALNPTNTLYDWGSLVSAFNGTVAPLVAAAVVFADTCTVPAVMVRAYVQLFEWTIERVDAFEKNCGMTTGKCDHVLRTLGVWGETVFVGLHNRHWALVDTAMQALLVRCDHAQFARERALLATVFPSLAENIG